MITGTYNLVADPSWALLQFQEVRLECDSTLGPVTINLPAISELATSTNLKLFIIDATNTSGINNITINSGSTTPPIYDTFDNSTTIQLVLNTNGSSVSLQNITTNQWLAIESNVAIATSAEVLPYYLEWNFGGATFPSSLYNATWKFRSPLAVQLTDEIFTAGNSLYNVPAVLQLDSMNSTPPTIIDFPTIEQFEGTVTMQPGIAQFSFNGCESFNFDSLKMAMGSFVFQGISSLANISFPSLEYAEDFNLNFVPQSSLNLPKLRGGQLYFQGNNNLTTISLPELVIGTMSVFTNSSISSIVLPKLKSLNITINQCSVLDTLSTPLLERISNIFIGGSPLLTSLNTDNVKYVFSFSLNTVGVTTLSFPKVEIVYNSFTLDGTSNVPLTQFTFGDTLKQYGQGGMNATGLTIATGLNQASVDNILIRLAALDGTNGTTLLNNRSINLGGSNASPSATGLTAKATLISRSCSVTTN